MIAPEMKSGDQQQKETMARAAISWAAYLCVRDEVFDRAQFVRFCRSMFDLFHDAEELGGPEAVLNRFQIREATLETIVKPILTAASRDPINGAGIE